MDTQWNNFIRELTPVFEANGLPCLTKLHLFSTRRIRQGIEELFDPWIHLGEKIKLEQLVLYVQMCKPLYTRLL